MHYSAIHVTLLWVKQYIHKRAQTSFAGYAAKN